MAVSPPPGRVDETHVEESKSDPILATLDLSIVGAHGWQRDGDEVISREHT